MDAAQREAGSLGEGSRVAYTCVRSMDTLGFPLREWCLLTAPWTGRNVSLGCHRPTSYKPSYAVGDLEPRQLCTLH